MRLTPNTNTTPLEICVTTKQGSLGCDVEVKFNPESALGRVRAYETFHNVTEVHWRYNTYGEPRVAIEPHGTYALTDIDHLDISAAVAKV